MLDKRDYGPAFKHLRLRAGLSYQEMADKLSLHGITYTNRSAVRNLEERGTIKGDVRRAYREIFGLSEDGLDAIASAFHPQVVGAQMSVS